MIPRGQERKGMECEGISIRQSVNQSGNPINHSVDPAHNQIRSDQTDPRSRAGRAERVPPPSRVASGIDRSCAAPRCDAMHCSCSRQRFLFFASLRVGLVWPCNCLAVLFLLNPLLQQLLVCAAVGWLFGTGVRSFNSISTRSGSGSI
jgi:hypothetical protein